MLTGVIGAIGGSLAGIGGSLLGGAQSESANKASQERSYEYYRKSLVESPLLTRIGLQRAGYNPMLALSGATAHHANIAPTSTNFTMPDIAGTARSGAALEKDLRGMMRLEKESKIEDVEAKRLSNRMARSDVETNEVLNTAKRYNAEAELDSMADMPIVRAQANRLDYYGSGYYDKIDLIKLKRKLDAYLNSKERQIILDSIRGAEGVSRTLTPLKRGSARRR